MTDSDCMENGMKNMEAKCELGGDDYTGEGNVAGGRGQDHEQRSPDPCWGSTAHAGGAGPHLLLPWACVQDPKWWHWGKNVPEKDGTPSGLLKKP